MLSALRLFKVCLRASNVIEHIGDPEVHSCTEYSIFFASLNKKQASVHEAEEFQGCLFGPVCDVYELSKEKVEFILASLFKQEAVLHETAQISASRPRRAA